MVSLGHLFRCLGRYPAAIKQSLECADRRSVRLIRSTVIRVAEINLFLLMISGIFDRNYQRHWNVTNQGSFSTPTLIKHPNFD